MARSTKVTDEDDEYSAQSAKELLDGWAITYGSHQKSCVDDITPAATPGSGDTWRFDLGVLGKGRGVDPVRGVGRTRSAIETVSRLTDDDDSDDSDGLSFLSQMEEASLAMETITRRTFEQSQATLLGRTSHHTDDLLGKGSNHSSRSTDTFDKDGRKLPSRSASGPEESCPCSDAPAMARSNGNADLLEQRRAARVARMEKVRQRIAREREEARAKKEDDERRERDLGMTEEARRKRAYEWYCRLGMVPKKEMKKRIKLLGHEAQVTEADCDLLPWNFNGTLVNTNKLQRLGLK